MNFRRTVRCGKCDRECEASGVIEIPCKVITKPGSVTESDGRKSIDNIYVIAPRVLCYFCYSISQAADSDLMHTYGSDCDMISILDDKYQELCDKYSDVFSELGLGLAIDKNGHQTAMAQDRFGTFVNGAIRVFDTAQFFIPAAVDEAEEKKPVQGMEIDEVDGNTSNTIVVEYKQVTNKQFSLQEIKALAEFIDAKEYDLNLTLKTWLKEQRFQSHHIPSLGIEPRKDDTNYARVYVLLFLCFNLYIWSESLLFKPCF